MQIQASTTLSHHPFRGAYLQNLSGHATRAPLLLSVSHLTPILSPSHFPPHSSPVTLSPLENAMLPYFPSHSTMISHHPLPFLRRPKLHLCFLHFFAIFSCFQIALKSYRILKLLVLFKLTSFKAPCFHPKCQSLQIFTNFGILDLLYNR